MILGPLLIALGIILICAVIGDAPDPEPCPSGTPYTGPRYSPWGHEIKQEARYV